MSKDSSYLEDINYVYRHNYVSRHEQIISPDMSKLYHKDKQIMSKDSVISKDMLFIF